MGKREKSSNQTQNNDEIQKLSSSLATLKNDLLELLKSEFKESTKHKRQFTFDVNFNSPIEKILIKTSTVWSPSHCYISSGSFNLDKNSPAFSEHQRRQTNYFANGGLNKVNRMEISFFSNHQTRSFKTYRSLISDSQRNPTILSRLKEAYNTPGGKNPLANPQAAQTFQNESLTKLLSETDVKNLTPEQKQHLKIAFAEGYLAANHPDNAKKDGRAMRYLKVCCFKLFVSSFYSRPQFILDFPTALDNRRVHGHLRQLIRIQQWLGVQVNISRICSPAM